MSNILDYLDWRGDLTFEASPFCEVDCVILARLSYIAFDNIVPNDFFSSISIKEAADKYLSTPDAAAKVYISQDIDLLIKLAKSQRFKDLKLCGYVNQIDLETQKQFSVLTINLRDDWHFTSFRGTDNTLVGWKEDFNMCFGPVPSQRLAVEYLNRVGRSISGNIVVGGHSKGGNLAVYAGAFCEKAIQEKITTVYNFDGPGFHDEVLETERYQQVCQRIKTFVPQSSVVGMMLGHGESFVIVHSGESGLLQHDVYSWEMERDRFSYVQAVTNSSRFVDSTLKHWLAEVEPEQRERFVDAVYAVLLETNAKTVKEVSENKFGNGKILLRALKKLEEEDRKAVLQALRALARCAKMSMSVISKPGRK